jgi:lipopolysaccharide biosynthesis glycosyltransferase
MLLEMNDLSTIPVQSTIQKAIECFTSGKYVESTELLLPLAGQVRKNSHISFYIGRNYLYLGKDVEAAEWFAQSLSSDPPFRWTHYELARLRDRQGDVVAAAGHLCGFLQDGTASELRLNSIHKDTIVAIANRCFSSHREAAVDLYRRINLAGMSTYLSELRVIEDLIDKKRTNAAYDLMSQLQSRHTLDAWGLFALSRIHHLREEADLAVATIHKVVEHHRDNTYLVVMACHRLADFRRLPDAQALFRSALSDLTTHDGNLQREIAGLTFRLHVHHRRHDEILVQPQMLAAVPNWILVEAVFEFALAGDQISEKDLQVAMLLADHLESDWPYSLGTILAVLHFCNRRRTWDRADKLLERIRNEPLFNHPEIVMRRFEKLCSMSKLDDAKAFYLEHYAGKKLGQWESCAVLRFMAEARMWKDAGEVLVQFLQAGYYFPTGEHFILRICRYNSLHLKLIDIIDRYPAADAPPQFPKLRQLLIDDVCVALGRQAVAPSDARAEEGQGAPEWRVSTRNSTLLKPQPARLEKVIGYLCTDKAYFFSVLTFLASYAAHNPQYVDTLEWAVFLDKEVPASWAAAVSKFASKLGLPLRTVPESKFMRADVSPTGLVERYGIFTGGNALSRAAFMRIYAAKHLYDSKRFLRAFYLDTDIVCQTDLTDFLCLQHGTNLLMARAEEDSPEIRVATGMHGLEASSYFNSGVLFFDFSKPEISKHLEHAIRLSEHESERLVFHDQCALNIAFAGRVQYLDKKFNHFLRPQRPENGDYSDSVLIHYLDKPKPWDVTYIREYRDSWLPYAAIVRMLLPPEIYGEIVAGANGVRRDMMGEFNDGVEDRVNEASSTGRKRRAAATAREPRAVKHPSTLQRDKARARAARQ